MDFLWEYYRLLDYMREDLERSVQHAAIADSSKYKRRPFWSRVIKRLDMTDEEWDCLWNERVEGGRVAVDLSNNFLGRCKAHVDGIYELLKRNVGKDVADKIWDTIDGKLKIVSRRNIGDYERINEMTQIVLGSLYKVGEMIESDR